MIKKILLLITLVLISVQCNQNKKNIAKTNSEKTGFIADSAMVVSARIEASKIGIQILKKGGNAFDAMIATHFALAVAYPFAGNIGGGGFMVYRKNNGENGALDFREKAPKLASKNMYLDKNGQVIKGKSTLGALAVGVPGSVNGMIKVYKKFGSLPFKELIQPAIDLAKKGVLVTKKQANNFKKYGQLFSKVNPQKVFLDQPWKAGDTIKYSALAKTLEKIRDKGNAGFYEGETAKNLVNYLQQLGGILTLDDLKNYQAVWRKPTTFTYKDLKIMAMSPPSSGGICIAQILKAIEPFDVSPLKHNSVKYIQLITEAERRAFADRSYFLGDPDFVKIPLDTLISSNYIQNRMKDFSWKKATPSSEVQHGNIIGFESNETTHYSIVDKFGNAVSVTTTLNGAYGSKVLDPNGGFLLNNEMDDFSAKPGVPNMFGLIGAKANAIAPEKRMLSSMTPTIVEKNHKLFMVVGSPGGSTIITSVLQTILNVYEFNFTMQEAVNAPRFHHQWLPDEITFEPKGFNKDTLLKLKNIGYTIKQKNTRILGKVDAILKLPNGKLEGGADYRGDDQAFGF
ncbi:MAG: gamma-glutamyltransferase [Lutibacter sp.]